MTPYHTAILAGEAGSLTHSLFNGTHLRVLWGPNGSNPKFDPLITTAYIRCNTCPNFVLLALLVPEILTRKGGCDVITPCLLYRLPLTIWRGEKNQFCNRMKEEMEGFDRFQFQIYLLQIPSCFQHQLNKFISFILSLIFVWRPAQ